MTPKVSFAVSMYNSAPYLERCLRSLFEQTLEELEFVIVDDCSTDDSIGVLTRVAEEYPHRKDQVKLIRHEVNQGSAASKRDVMLAASGEYLIVIDSDDYVDKRMAQMMYDKACACDADLVVCGVYCERAHSAVLAWVSDPEDPFVEDKVRHDMLCRNVVPGLWCRLVRKSVILNDSFVWPDHNFAEDVVISIQIAIYARRIARVESVLYYYCFNSSSICNTIGEMAIMRRYNDYFNNINQAIAILKQNKLYDFCKNDILVSMKKVCKNMLLPLTTQRKYRRLWHSTFPEVDWFFIIGRRGVRPSYREWIWYSFVCAGLQPKYRKRLRSRRLRIRTPWEFPQAMKDMRTPKIEIGTFFVPPEGSAIQG